MLSDVNSSIGQSNSFDKSVHIDLNTTNNTNNTNLQANATTTATKTLNHISNPLVRSITNINASQHIRDIEGGLTTDTWQAKHFPRGIDYMLY